MARKTIKLDYLARVEGEGAFKVLLRDGVVKSAELKIFEPPRFFEALLRGRDFREAPDITARICGICPVAYQMSAVHAMEKALGVKVDGNKGNGNGKTQGAHKESGRQQPQRFPSLVQAFFLCAAV